VSEEATVGVDLAPERAAAMVDEGAMLIDVRRDYEWDAGHVAGARHIEVNELTAAADSIPGERPVVFVCRSGSRSALAAAAFREAGWDAHHVEGGLYAWVEAALPIDGEIAEPRPE
jgi:rhodanese-related sulfurtransferase